VRHLRDGEGTHDGHTSSPTLPLSVQAGSSETGNLARELGMLGDDDQLDEDDSENFAMVARVAEVEGSDPTSDNEAHKHCDWPK
jgi:hypothetical protein